MAHFAELNSSNEVLQVVVISNTDVDANGGDESSQAETFVASLVPFNPGGSSWKQTSYSGSFRKQFAGPDMVYNPIKDKFIRKQPYATWTLNNNDNWVAPITYPNDVTDKNLVWDDTNQKWIATDNSDPVNNFDWNSSELTWVSV